MIDWYKLDIHDTLALLEQKQISSYELINELIKTIKKQDARLNAYLDVDEETALKQSKLADEMRSKGEKGKVLGIPLAIKDLINVKGQPCRCASKILEGYISPYDATAIAKLRKEGAIFLGRTNMDEFAMGSSTENSAYPPTRNPWNNEYVPGGSSGGSAAAVAGGEAIAALGSDTGGSVRQPASFCGCVGLKPSYGRVSRYGLTAFASSFDQIGPITKSVKDAALLLSIISGADENDSTAMPLPPFDLKSIDFSDKLAGIKIGVSPNYFQKGLASDVEKSVKEAIEHCKRLGAEIKEINLSLSDYAIAVYYILACAEASANLARFDGVRYGKRSKAVSIKDPIEMYEKTRAEFLGAEVKRRIILGTYVLSSGYYDAFYKKAQKARTLIRKDFEEAFKKCDVICSPVSPSPAFKLGEKVSDPLQMYLGDVFTVPANIAGICAISVPCGISKEGLPIGLQVIGPAFREDLILKVSYAYEQVAGLKKSRPPE
jgi:aspartyl-tRNA(Asn)/glutamyl-tRNA(Gln) amidotransferase subunit A